MATNLKVIGLQAIARALQMGDTPPSDLEHLSMAIPYPGIQPPAGAAQPDAPLAAQNATAIAHSAAATG